VETIEIRCPVGPRRLLSKLLVDGGRPKHVDGNLIEFACDDCKRTLRRQGETLSLVLHRYDLAGNLVETLVER
jgi:hypothetical protein